MTFGGYFTALYCCLYKITTQKIMKITFSILFVFFILWSQVSWYNISISDPTFSDVNWENNIMWSNWDYVSGGIISSSKFCEGYGGSIFSLSIISHGTWALVYDPEVNIWEKNYSDDRISNIVCDISEKKEIQKQIFDKESIDTIFQMEAIVMFFLLFFKFFRRVSS